MSLRSAATAGDDRLGWSGSASMPMIDRTKLRIAVASGKITEVVAAINGVEMGSALQQAGTGLLKAYRTAKPAERSSLAPILFSLSQRLKERGWTGDNLLAAEFLAEIRGEELTGRPLPVDLDEMSTIMADHSDYPGGGSLNLETGEVVYASLTDAALVGEDAAVDLDEGDWEHVVDDSHEGWDDMADFAVSIKDRTIRETLEDAIQGKGAFSRFRRAVHRADLAEEWYCFADDRRWGRARQELADLGIRPV
jgi:hypothetical protein